MALQAKAAGDRERRVSNPERDMVWALPRIIGKAIGDTGSEMTRDKFAAHLKDMLREQGISFGYQDAGGDYENDMPADKLLEDYGDFVKAFGALWHYLRDDPKGVGLIRLRLLFKGERFRPFRLLISHLLMARLMAETSYWICQVEASSDDPPRPSIERIDEATSAVLSYLQ